MKYTNLFDFPDLINFFTLHPKDVKFTDDDFEFIFDYLDKVPDEDARVHLAFLIITSDKWDCFTVGQKCTILTHAEYRFCINKKVDFPPF